MANQLSGSAPIVQPGDESASVLPLSARRAGDSQASRRIFSATWFCRSARSAR
jgi:hypothetical protein